MEKIVTYKLNDNVYYDVILPSVVNSDTPVLVYACTIDALYDKLANSIANSGINAVVVIPKPKYWVPYDEYSKNFASMVDNVKSMYSIKNSGYISNGFSQQAYTAIKTKVNYLQSNPTAERQLILLNDGVPLSSKDGNISELLSDDDIKVLEQNRSFIVDYCQMDKWQNVGNKILNSNLDILFISDEKLPGNDFWSNHSYVYYNSYESGLYTKVLDFVYGNGDLPASGFVYRLYNHETGRLEEYTASELKSKLNLTLEDFKKLHGDYVVSYSNSKLDYIKNSSISDLFNGKEDIISSDLEHIKNLVLNIEKSIKKYGNDLSSELSFKGLESTTKIPSSIPSLIEQYAVYNTNAIYKLNNLLENIVKIALMYKDTDDSFNEDVEDTQYNSQLVNPVDNNTDIENIEYNSQSANSTNNNTNVDINYNTIVNSGIVSGATIISNIDTEYNSLISNANRIVLKASDVCKIVLNKDEKNVTSIEYCYKYNSNDIAKSVYDELLKKYDNNENIDKIIIKNNLVKIIYNMNMFPDKSIESMKEYYNKYEQI